MFEYLIWIGFGFFIALIIDLWIVWNRNYDYIETIKEEILVNSKYKGNANYNVVLYYNGIPKIIKSKTLYDYAKPGENIIVETTCKYAKGECMSIDIQPLEEEEYSKMYNKIIDVQYEDE